MNFYTASELLIFITSGSICLFIFLNNPKTKTNQYFSYYAFSVAIWGLFQFLSVTSNSQSKALFFWKICITSALFISSTFFHFTCHLTHNYLKHSKIVKLLYILNFLAIPLIFSPLLIADVSPQLMFSYWIKAGNLFILFVLQYLFSVAFSLFIIYEKLKSTTGLKHQQLKYIFYGILIAYLGGLTNFPLCYNYQIPPFGNILVPVYCLFITYAIFKYQLMDINPIIKKSLVYTILTSVITLFYFISTYCVQHAIEPIIGYSSLLISICSAMIVAIAFIPLKNLIQLFVEKNLFHGSYTEIAKQNELLRQEILQTERLKAVATLASGMAHEIKNPITVIKTFSEYLPEKMDDKKFLKKFAPMIAQEVNRIDNLVHELLDFSRPATPVLKETNIHNLIKNTLELLSNEYIKHHIKINTDYNLAPETTLLLDHNQIKQALLNILLNAIDAMPHGGQLNISTYPSFEGEKINIKVQDSGIGINHEDLQHIFDPFFSKKDSGTGLGLAITHEIIRNHGGKIFVESTKGNGAVFILEFTLPHSNSL